MRSIESAGRACNYARKAAYTLVAHVSRLVDEESFCFPHGCPDGLLGARERECMCVRNLTGSRASSRIRRVSYRRAPDTYLYTRPGEGAAMYAGEL